MDPYNNTTIKKIDKDYEYLKSFKFKQKDVYEIMEFLKQEDIKKKLVSKKKENIKFIESMELGINDIIKEDPKFLENMAEFISIFEMYFKKYLAVIYRRAAGPR